MRKKARAEAGKLATSLGRNVDEIDFAAVTGLEEVLASSAFMFSNLWLNDALRRSLNPTLPQIENTDGDPLEFITVHFPLISKAKLPAIRTALDDLPSLWKESDGLWNWIEAKAPPRKAAKRSSPVLPGGARARTAPANRHGFRVHRNHATRRRQVTMTIGLNPRKPTRFTGTHIRARD